jgi:ABC-type dipeptide/oligopeptide/nickel transport system permease component
MTQYVIRRLVQAVIVVLGVSMIAFGVIFVTGDPTYLLLGEVTGLTEQQIADFRHQMGFDRPWIIQYLDYMEGAVQGDLGKSIYHGVPNSQLIVEFLPATLQLGTAALIISVIVGIPVGLIAASYRGRLADHISMIAALIGQAMPIFWLGLLLMLLFSVNLKWLPVSGMGGWKHLILPAVTLASYPMAQNARLVRSSMLETLGQDYIRTARAKGLSEWAIVRRHALKNVMIPVITLIGIQVGYLMSGSIVTETIFAWPGMGRLIIQAIRTKDIPLVQASVIVLAVTFVGINLIVDLTYAYLDPRIRLAKEEG